MRKEVRGPREALLCDEQPVEETQSLEHSCRTEYSVRSKELSDLI
jgi:hypothetical protein